MTRKLSVRLSCLARFFGFEIANTNYCRARVAGHCVLRFEPINILVLASATQAFKTRGVKILHDDLAGLLQDADVFDLSICGR